MAGIARRIAAPLPWWQGSVSNSGGLARPLGSRALEWNSNAQRRVATPHNS